MKKLQLEIFLHIIGLGSASGLIYKNNAIMMISDNAGFLYEYNLSSDSLLKTPLFDSDVMENIPKPQKADLEAITSVNDTIYVFGSGSTTNRNLMFTIEDSSKKVLATYDMADFYAVLKSFGQISDADFNIEGVVYSGDHWYFFQRGNQGSGKNGIFTISGDITGFDYSIMYNEYRLPKLSGVETCFTDATLVGDTLYFLATAEKTVSAYDDGEVVGTIIGEINLKKMKIGKTRTVSKSHKFEGITLYESGEDMISFLLCEDNDSNILESTVYKVTVRK